MITLVEIFGNQLIKFHENPVRKGSVIPQRNFLVKNFIKFVSASSDAAICRYIGSYSLVEEGSSFFGIYGYVGCIWVSSPSNLAFLVFHTLFFTNFQVILVSFLDKNFVFGQNNH